MVDIINAFKNKFGGKETKNRYDPDAAAYAQQLMASQDPPDSVSQASRDALEINIHTIEDDGLRRQLEALSIIPAQEDQIVRMYDDKGNVTAEIPIAGAPARPVSWAMALRVMISSVTPTRFITERQAVMYKNQLRNDCLKIKRDMSREERKMFTHYINQFERYGCEAIDDSVNGNKMLSLKTVGKQIGVKVNNNSLGGNSMSEQPLATPIQFIVDKSQLDSMQMWIILGAVFAVCFFVLLIYFLQDKYRTPKQANNLTNAHRKHIPMILLEGLDGFCDLIPLHEFIAQVLESKPFGKGKKKRTFRFALPQKVNVDELPIDVNAEKNERLTKQVMKGLNDQNNMKINLRGVDAPFFVGSKNRAIAARFPFLTSLSLLNTLERLCKEPAAITALKISPNAKLREIGAVLETLSLGVSGVDFHALYKDIDINYDPTIQESISERDKTDGRLERSEDKDKPTKTILVLVLGIIGIIIAGAVVIKVL